MKFSSLIQLVVLSGIANAVPATNVPKDCSAEIRALHEARQVKRGLEKRSLYWTMPNFNCVLSPETPKDNYQTPPNTSNIADGQEGVAFTLDIGLMDVDTCQILTDATVEIWSANSQGDYGDFLRGTATSESNGIAEFNTIFPGFTSDGANHVNILVKSPSGQTHVGQGFFTDPWTNVIGGSVPYNTNKHTRILNANDPNYQAAGSAGYNALIDVEEIQDDWPAGISGYITVGVHNS